MMNYLTADGARGLLGGAPACAPAISCAASRSGITKLYDNGMVPSGLKITQLPIFVGLGSEGDLPLSVLADGLRSTARRSTRNLKVLEDRGLIRTLRARRRRPRADGLDDARGLGDADRRAGALGGGPGVRRGAFGRERLVALEDELAAFAGPRG